MTETSDTYTHGHHESVLRSHIWRNAENSAAFLLSRLRSGDRLLDVGCGPGTISVDLARLVEPGEVTAIDVSEEVIERARSLAGSGAPTNLDFRVGNVYALDFADETFDVVYAHQVLQHLSDPVSALREIRRVLRDDGVLAVRDADYSSFIWYPADARLTKWMSLYHEVMARNGAEADAGRHLGHWVREAGFCETTLSSSNWTYTSDEERAWWGQLWADRIRESAFAAQAVSYGMASSDDLNEIADGFIDWSNNDEGLFVVVNVEVLARK